MSAYICIIRKVHPLLLRKETSFCVRKIRNIILSIYRLEIASPAEEVQG